MSTLNPAGQRGPRTPAEANTCKEPVGEKKKKQLDINSWPKHAEFRSQNTSDQFLVDLHEQLDVLDKISVVLLLGVVQPVVAVLVRSQLALEGILERKIE